MSKQVQTLTRYAIQYETKRNFSKSQHSKQNNGKYLEFVLCISPIQVHTRTHPEQWAAIFCHGTWGAVGDLVPCSRVSPQLWYWEWKVIHSPLPLQSLPVSRLESATFGLHIWLLHNIDWHIWNYLTIMTSLQIWGQNWECITKLSVWTRPCYLIKRIVQPKTKKNICC